MTTDDRAARLTAFALNDPSLTAADRAEIETTLATDATARREVEETKQLAGLLTAGLAAELSAQPAEPPVAIPSARLARRPDHTAKFVLLAVAASILVAAVGIGTGVFLNVSSSRRVAWQQTAASPKGTDGVGPLDDDAVRADPGIPNTAPTEGAMMMGTTAGPRGDTSATREAFGGARGGAPADGRTTTEPGRNPNLTTAATPFPPASGPLPGGPAGGGLPRPAGKSAPAGLPPGPVSPVFPPATSPRPLDDKSIDLEKRAVRLRGDDKGEFRELPPGTPSPGEAESAEIPSPNDRYRQLLENQFVPVKGEAALSTFGVDVDTASYAIVRKYLTMGQLPPTSAVRLEELVNYFPYADKAPDGDNPFAVTVELAECPWAPKHRLARIGLKAKPVMNDKRPPSNLVFLIDVSGSMNQPNKLPLVKQSLRMLVNQLGENDHVAMVVYAGTTGLVLDSTTAAKKDVILAALDRLEAGGSTNGSGGLQQAYAVAVANFKKGGTNRVVLCTDGDWNVGTTSTAELVKMVEEKRKTGVFLSVFGFGMGNLRDEMMVQLAGKGNGNYAYIDTLKESHKALVEQLGGTLVTVAKDVKIQVEFNPAKVAGYRLLGYEKRALAAKDFADDTKDAGEMGAGHVVTALYELVPAGGAVPGGKVDGLRYQQPDVKPRASNESFVVKMRHKKPDGDVSTLRELPVTDPGKGYAEASEDFRFAASVAAFALILRDSAFKGEASFALVQELAQAATKHDPSGYRAEFVELVKRAKAVSGKP